MAEASAGGKVAARPLSPHVQIYARLINMVVSMMHRLTGAALYFGTLILAVWLIAAASGPAAFQTARDLLATLPGQIVLLGYTWALIHHALGGLRHLVWDTGRGFSLGAVNFAAWLTIVTALLLTAAVWVIGLKLGGRL